MQKKYRDIARESDRDIQRERQEEKEGGVALDLAAGGALRRGHAGPDRERERKTERQRESEKERKSERDR